jgi:hypothetical protein
LRLSLVTAACDMPVTFTGKYWVVRVDFYMPSSWPLLPPGVLGIVVL